MANTATSASNAPDEGGAVEVVELVTPDRGSGGVSATVIRSRRGGRGDPVRADGLDRPQGDGAVLYETRVRTTRPLSPPNGPQNVDFHPQVGDIWATQNPWPPAWRWISSRSPPASTVTVSSASGARRKRFLEHGGGDVPTRTPFLQSRARGGRAPGRRTNYATMPGVGMAPDKGPMGFRDQGSGFATGAMPGRRWAGGWSRSESWRLSRPRLVLGLPGAVFPSPGRWPGSWLPARRVPRPQARRPGPGGTGHGGDRQRRGRRPQRSGDRGALGIPPPDVEAATRAEAEVLAARERD